MHISFNEVTIDGFFSFDLATINLKNLGVVTVKGINEFEELADSNGSGKSAIFESIIWAITGITPRGATNVANSILGRGVGVTLDLNIDSDHYVITRYRDHVFHGNELKIVLNDEDISGNTLTKTKAVIAEELKHLQYDNLTSIMILSQGLPNRLSTLTPSSRKARLETLSQSNHYIDSLNQKLSDSSKVISQKTQDAMTEITGYQKEAESCDYQITSINNQIERIKSDSESESAFTQEEYQIMKQKYDGLLQEISEKERISNQMQQNIAAARLTIRDLDREMNQLGARNVELMELYGKYQNSTCPTCGQRILNQSDIQDSLSRILSEITANKTRLAAIFDEMAQHNSNIERIENESTTNQEDMVGIRDYSMSIKKILDDYKPETGQSLSLLTEQITELTEKRNKALAEADRMQPILTKLQQDGVILSYYKNQSSKKFRSFLLEGVIDYLNLKAEEYSGYLFHNHDPIHLLIEGNEINIYLGDRRIENLSGGESRKVDIILQLIQRDLAKNESGLSSNLLVLDEVLDYLDEAGINSVLDLLTHKSPDTESMMVVTHKRDIRLPADGEIVVIKDKDEVSRIAR